MAVVHDVHDLPAGRSLYRDLRPLVVLLRAYGILPIAEDRASGDAVFRWGSLPLLLALAVWLSAALTALQSAAEQLALVRSASEQHRPLFQTVFLALGALILVYLPLLPLTAWAEARDVCELLNRWRRLQLDYESLSLLLSRGSRTRVAGGARGRCWRFVALVLGVTLPMSFVTSLLMPDYPPWRMLPYMQYNAFVIGVPALWDGVLWASARFAKNLAALPIDSAASLRAHRLLWMRLNATLTLLGTGLSRTKRLFLLLIFAEWIVSFFTVVSIVLSGHPLWHAFIPVFMAIMAASLLYLSSNAAQVALDAVRCCSRNELLRLRTLPLSGETVNEVNIFLNTIHTTAADSISVEGYYDISRSTVVTYLKTTGTYLVILSQFALTMSDDVTAGASFGSGTGL